MSTTAIILSGAYIAQDLMAELGALPPAFVPNGNSRLYRRQLQSLDSLNATIILTLPQDYTPPEPDLESLAEAGVEIQYADPALSLAAALARVVRNIPADSRVVVLFGDTVVEYPGAFEPDTFAVSETHHFAKWAEYSVQNGAPRFHEAFGSGGRERDVVAGLFDFADRALLLEALDRTPSFIKALNFYAERRMLTPKRASMWLDFGHLHTYYQSRRQELAARAFNRVSAEGGTVKKTGTPHRKIFAEASWYEALPPSLITYTPSFVSSWNTPEFGYELEYLHLPILSDIFVFGELSKDQWLGIILSCRDFLLQCHKITPQPHEVPEGYTRHFYDEMIQRKTMKRIGLYAETNDIAFDTGWTINGEKLPNLERIIQALTSVVGETASEDLCFWHGDFHLANIFFDFRAQRIRTVDPRGMLSDGSLTLYGDARYDIAKLTHSIIGLYDFILAGRYEMDWNKSAVNLTFKTSTTIDEVIAEFSRTSIGRYECGSPEILAMTALLFFSMLPLHSDSPQRQRAMFANALRLTSLAGIGQ